MNERSFMFNPAVARVKRHLLLQSRGFASCSSASRASCGCRPRLDDCDRADDLQSDYLSHHRGGLMRTLLKRLILLLAVAIVVTLVWDQRDRIALLTNNDFRIQGDWYQVEMSYKGDDRYNFSDRIITRNGIEWGSYRLRSNTRLEVVAADQLNVYQLAFPDDDTMVWSVEIEGRSVPALEWSR
jgi:hypothetical protein